METDPNDNQPASSDEDADAELMYSLGQEIRNFFDEQFQIFVARVDDRLNSQTEVFGAKMDLEREILGARLDLQKEMLASQTQILDAIRTLQAAMLAPRVIIEDANGRPAGIKTLLS